MGLRDFVPDGRHGRELRGARLAGRVRRSPVRLRVGLRRLAEARPAVTDLNAIAALFQQVDNSLEDLRERHDAAGETERLRSPVAASMSRFGCRGWHCFVPSDGFPESRCFGESWVDRNIMEGTGESPFVEHQRRSYCCRIMAREVQTERRENMRIYVTNVFVDDQDKAEKFYTDVLGFKVKNNIPLGENRWLTVVSSEDPEGTELLLEPSDHPAVKPYQEALVSDGIPAHSFQVQDLDAERKRLGDLGVEFAVEPMDAGPVRMAVFDDTCGNLIQLIQMMDAAQ